MGRGCVVCVGVGRVDIVSFGCWIGGSGVVFCGLVVCVGIGVSRVSTTDCIVGVSSLRVFSCDMSEMSMPMLKCFFMFALRIV